MNVAGPPLRQPALGAGNRWIVRGQDTTRAAALARVPGISPIVAALLISRGYDDEPSARAFLRPSYEQLHEPFLMHLQQTPDAFFSTFGGILYSLALA